MGENRCQARPAAIAGRPAAFLLAEIRPSADNKWWKGEVKHIRTIREADTLGVDQPPSSVYMSHTFRLHDQRMSTSETPTETNTHQRHGLKVAMAALAAFTGVALAVHQVIRTSSSYRAGYRPLYNQRVGYPAQLPAIRKSEDGRQWLWARGPRNAEDGEWFEITDSPLDPSGYQYGIGKDSIPSIDEPEFIPISDREKLREHGIRDETIVIGYVHNGEAKAYPIAILDRHELVNDFVGGKPVTVGW